MTIEPFTFFISYRRRDSAPFALLLKYEIERRLQFVHVGIDVENINAGNEFPKRIESMIEKAHATIVLIGKNWMPKESDKKDWVVRELIYSNQSFNAEMEKNLYKLPARKIFPLFIDCNPDFNLFEIPDTITYIKDLNAREINYADWPRRISIVIKEIATELRINERLEKKEPPEPSRSKANTQPMTDDELAKILAYDDYYGWSIDNFGNDRETYLVKNFKFKDFNEVKIFMAKVSDYCSIISHHPDWRNVYNTVTVSLTTWDAQNKITIFDLNLALYMNKVASSFRS